MPRLYRLVEPCPEEAVRLVERASEDRPVRIASLASRAYRIPAGRALGALDAPDPGGPEYVVTDAAAGKALRGDRSRWAGRKEARDLRKRGALAQARAAARSPS